MIFGYYVFLIFKVDGFSLIFVKIIQESMPFHLKSLKEFKTKNFYILFYCLLFNNLPNKA